MKKFILIGCLMLLVACQTQTATPTSEISFFLTETPPPTPIPDTPTPEPTFTPVPTPTPLPQYFTTNFDSSLAGWSMLQGGNESIPNISTENNTLRLEMDSPFTSIYALYGPFDYTDVHIETEYINSALVPASAGLICRYSDTDGWLEYNVLTDGTYNVLYGTWLDTGIADYLPIIDGTTKEIKQSGDVQQIGLDCAGTILRLYVNGTIIRTVDVTSYELATGKAGLTAASYENTPVIVVFDSVTISELLSP